MSDSSKDLEKIGRWDKCPNHKGDDCPNCNPYHPGYIFVYL